MNNYIPGCVMMIDNKMKSSIRVIPKECIMHDWWIAMYATYLGNIVSVKEKLHQYRQHGDNAIGAKQDRLEKNDKEKALKKLKKRKKQNNKFLIEFKALMEDYDIKIFNRFNRMCSQEHSIKAIGIFMYHFRTNIREDNNVYLNVIFNDKF